LRRVSFCARLLISSFVLGFIAGMVYSYAKAFPNTKSKEVGSFTVSSASSQSYSDATNVNEKINIDKMKS
jgi:GDP-mannose transporter